MKHIRYCSECNWRGDASQCTDDADYACPQCGEYTYKIVPQNIKTKYTNPAEFAAERFMSKLYGITPERIRQLQSKG